MAVDKPRILTREHLTSWHPIHLVKAQLSRWALLLSF